MKMKKMKAAMAAMAIVALTFTACSGDDGDAGPAGATGATGNANVSASTETVMSMDWVGTTVKRNTLSVAGITQAVVDNGTVQVFQKETDSTSWEALPYSYVIGLNTQGGTVAATITIQAAYNVGEVRLAVINSLGANIGLSANFPGDRDFKVVVIPSSSLVDGVDVNNYEELKMVYGIEEYDVK